MASSQAPTLGEFEQLVLLAIIHQDEDAYGVTIRREIERRTRRTVAVGALYTALDRLEAKGLVTSAMSLPTRERGGRSKRFFTVTTAGEKALLRSRDTMTRMWSGLQPDLSRSR
ncbi:MAG: PadR family transcriptional regulator [Vicinamibacterales bacterium]